MGSIASALLHWTNLEDVDLISSAVYSVYTALYTASLQLLHIPENVYGSALYLNPAWSPAIYIGPMQLSVLHILAKICVATTFVQSD